MLLKPLPTLRVRSVERLIATAHEPLVIIAEDYDVYYLKYHKGQSYELQAEWICQYLLHLWGIPTPDSAVLFVPEQLIQAPPKFLRRLTSYLRGPCFGSKQIPFARDSAEVLQKHIEPELLINHDDLVWLSLFDAWVGNDDRWASHHNTVIAPNSAGSLQSRMWAIDHAYAFGRLDPRHLVSEYRYYDLQKNLIKSHATQLIISDWKVKRPLFIGDELRQGLNERIGLCQAHFEQICGQLPESYKLSSLQQTKLSDMLFSQSRLDRMLREFLSFLQL